MTIHALSNVSVRLNGIPGLGGTPLGTGAAGGPGFGADTLSLTGDSLADQIIADVHRQIQQKLAEKGISWQPGVGVPGPVAPRTPMGPAPLPLPPVQPPTTPGQGPVARGPNMDQEGVPRLVAAIKADTEIMNAFNNWQRLTQDQKMAIGQKVVHRQGEIFGFRPVPMGIDPSLAGSRVGGYYGGGRLKLSPSSLEGRGRFINTIVHEQTHAMKAQFRMPEAPGHNGGDNGDLPYRVGDGVERGLFGTDNTGPTRRAA